MFAALWVLYISIYTVGQTFMHFQWDILLLEAGGLAVLAAPLVCLSPPAAGTAATAGATDTSKAIAPSSPAAAGKAVTGVPGAASSKPITARRATTNMDTEEPSSGAAVLRHRWFADDPGVALFMVRWLLFRLMFLSGIVKLTSGCPTWWGLTALSVHYESQCIPTPLAWYTHHLPAWLHAVGVVATYV